MSVCVCAFRIHPDFFTSQFLNDMQLVDCARVCFHILFCLALIISVRTFYVRTSAIMTTDERISSGTNINTTGWVCCAVWYIATVHNENCGTISMKSCEQKHSHIVAQTNSSCLFYERVSALLVLLPPPPTLFLPPTHLQFLSNTGKKAQAETWRVWNEKLAGENAVWHPSKYPSLH